MKPVITFLSINRAIVGVHRAAWLFQGCRYAAQRLDPNCYIQAAYVDHERVGWFFSMKDQQSVMVLHHCHAALMQDRPLEGLLP